jgi:thymidylate synthase (FAD)
MSFQEFSQRYADPVSHMSFENREVRLQDKKNRQNSISVSKDSTLQTDFEELQNEMIDNAKILYSKALEKGIAKEQARVLLPEGLIKTRMYVSGTLRSWLHYVEVRTDPSTQKEHREIALACAEEIGKVFPLILTFVNKEEEK